MVVDGAVSGTCPEAVGPPTAGVPELPVGAAPGVAAGATEAGAEPASVPGGGVAAADGAGVPELPGFELLRKACTFVIECVF